jgi:hypothetical protein
MYSVSDVSTDITSCKTDFHRVWYPALRLSFPSPFLIPNSSDIPTYQAIKDVNASYDALIELLETIEHFLNRLDIYTNLPLTGAMGKIIVKIMVELLSTIALVTKQITQSRPGESVSVYGVPKLTATQ